jgi:hypothetical protein
MSSSNIATEKAAAIERAGLSHLTTLEWTFRRDGAGVLEVVVPETLDRRSKLPLLKRACVADHEPTVKWLTESYGCSRREYNIIRHHVMGYKMSAKRLNKKEWGNHQFIGIRNPPPTALYWLNTYTESFSRKERKRVSSERIERA